MSVIIYKYRCNCLKVEIDVNKTNDIALLKTNTKEETRRSSHAWSILCVDDEASVLSALNRLFKTKPYKVFLANSAKEGLKLLEQNSIDIVVSDMRMPEMSGAEFLTKVAKHYAHTFRILLTGYSDLDSTIQAVNKGKIHRYLQKPWNNHEIIQTMEESIARLCLERDKQQLLKQLNHKNKALNELNKKLEDKVYLRTRQIRAAMAKLEMAKARIEENHNATLKVFYNLISQNEHLGGKAAVKISELCKVIAKKMNLDTDTVKDVHLAGLLNELGLLGLPSLLITTPFRELDRTQQKLFKEHPEIAYVTLTPATSLADVALYIKHQYEQIDGRGFPDSITGEQIPVGSRILAIARDYIQAINGKLCQGRLSSEGAMEFLNMHAEQIYDKEILKLLPDILPELELTALKYNECLMAIEQVKPEMVLSRSIFNDKDILLLPEKHRFTVETLQRLKRYTQNAHQAIKIYIFEQPQEH